MSNFKIKGVLTILLIAVSNFTFSQKNDFNVEINKKEFGRNLLSNTAIHGFEYVFPEKIYTTYIDSISGILTVQLRESNKKGKWKKKGTLLFYDLKDNTIKWNKKINYNTTDFLQFNNIVLYAVGSKTYCFNIQDGNELWNVQNNISFVDLNHQIGIGYKITQSTSSNELRGIDLKTGKILWEKELDRQYGWNNAFHINDSFVAISANGLHALNLKNGNGWKHSITSTKNDYTRTAIYTVLGVAVGMLTGVAIIPIGNDVVYGISSNFLIDSSFIYLASKENLSKINKSTGAVIWQTPFQENTASKSSVFIKDSILYMINNGYAYLNNKWINFGKPFIAAFDKQTGKEKFISFLEKGLSILDFQIIDNDIYLVSFDRIGKYSAKDGSLLIEKKIISTEFGNFKYFIGNHVYATDESAKFYSLPQSDTTKIFVFTETGKTIALDKQLNIDKPYNPEKLNLCCKKTNSHLFIEKPNSIWIINNEGEKVAEVEASPNSYLIGNMLYDKQDNRFIAIDLNEIIKE